MRVVLLFESPGADRVSAQFTDAADEFNRGLDIRLRFLEVGFDVHSLPVPADSAAPAEELAGLLEEFRPGVVLALGSGTGLLECAAAAAKKDVPIAYLADGAPDRAARAVARLSGILVATGEADPPAAAPGAMVENIRELPPGPELVRILVRSVRERR
jgi:hypothetical protein